MARGSPWSSGGLRGVLHSCQTRCYIGQLDVQIALPVVSGVRIFL